jgi:hypothetical protein
MGGGASIAFCATSENFPPPRKRRSGRDHATNFTPKSSGDPHVRQGGPRPVPAVEERGSRRFRLTALEPHRRRRASAYLPSAIGGCRDRARRAHARGDRLSPRRQAAYRHARAADDRRVPGAAPRLAAPPLDLTPAFHRDERRRSRGAPLRNEIPDAGGDFWESRPELGRLRFGAVAGPPRCSP